MDPLKRFEEEHQHGLRELERLERAALALANTEGSVEHHIATAREVADFLSTDVKQHNENEERALFALLTDDLPWAPFVEEHERLRDLESELHDALDSADPVNKVPPVAHALIDLLRSHIAREDEVLFPMSREFLGPDGLADVAKRLGEMET